MMLRGLLARHNLPCKLYNYPNWDCSEELRYSSMYAAARDALLDVASSERPAVVLAASMGCHFALRLALGYPNLIGAIVSVGGTFNPGENWLKEDSSDWVYVGSPYADNDESYKLPKMFLSDLQANYITNLKDIHLPVEVVHGTKDESIGVEIAKTLAELLPMGTLHLVEGGDHRLSTEGDLRLIESLLEKHLLC